MLHKEKGFTLLELLIVIAIIAVLSVILVLVLNPAESLAKARDSQRISDLSTLKTALGIYMTTIGSPQLDGTSGAVNDQCDGGTAANERIWLSVADTASGGESVTDTTPPSGWSSGGSAWEQISSATTLTLVDGTGWLPVNFAAIVGGSPISNLPLDPANDVSVGASTAAAVTNDALMYRYVCTASPLSFEINAGLESIEFGSGGDNDRVTNDGGNNANLFEVGTNLTLLPGTNDF